MADANIGRLKRNFSLFSDSAQILFFIQIFSTLSFSVLYSTLVLYLTDSLGFSGLQANAVTGFFIAYNFALHLLGGYVGGRLLSNRLLFSLGMISQVIGCLLLAKLSLVSLYLGLAFFLTGSGLNVTCINCMLTQRYQPSDPKRETAFLWNYSGMNLGFFTGFSLSGYFQLHANYSTLFLVSSLGNLIALMIVLFNWQKLADLNTVLTSLPKKKQVKRLFFGIFTVATLIPILWFCSQHAKQSNQVVILSGIMAVIAILVMSQFQPTPAIKKRLYAFIILMVAGFIFWVLYQIAPMGLTLFIRSRVDNHLWGQVIPPQWFQNINTVVIVLGGPILGLLLQYLRSKGMNISIPYQFAFALLLIGVGFIILPIGIASAHSALVSIHWVIASYILQSLGELFISPIGYAMVGRLAPQKLQGIMMGTWMMVTGVAAIFSNYFSNLMVEETSGAGLNDNFPSVFNQLGYSALLAAIVLSFVGRKIQKLIDGRNDELDEKVITGSTPA